MTIRKEPSGKFRAVLKVGREYVAGRTFDTKREAQAWLARERAAIAGGVDPRAGRATVRSLLPVWLEERRHSVSAKTYVSDAALVRLVPHSLAALSVNAVTDREVSRALITLTQDGLAEASVRRFRASLSSFFAWAVRERLILVNPVLRTRVPKVGGPRTEMYPFGEEDLEHIHAAAAEKRPAAGRHPAHRRLDRAAVVGAAGRAGPRLRRGADADTGGAAGRAGGRRDQDDQVRAVAAGAGRRSGAPAGPLDGGRGEADAPLFVTSSGHRLHSTAFKRTLGWSTLAEGRRIHDLRHTAACLWLARGVDPGTVQAWMGHASIATTNLYLHHLGTPADRAGLARLNARGHAGGTRKEAGSE